MAWWFYFSKFIDFADSIFFVLRKKKDQLSTLHIIHHSTMPIFSWFGPKVGQLLRSTYHSWLSF
jgi:hypothetical protein